MVSSLPRIAVLGAGHMAGAILTGLVSHGFAHQSIRVTTAHAKENLSTFGGTVEYCSLDEDPLANQWAVEGADIILLGVKPYSVLELLHDVKDAAPAHAVMVSIAAGVTLGQMEKVWPGAVIRTMPNTPAEIGQAVTGVAMGSKVERETSDAVVSLLKTVGDVLVVPEESINALSAISGSGPAFVYFLIERFQEVAESHGFSPEQASLMVRGTFRGALDLLDHSGKTPDVLRDEVTSPGGSTQAALRVFEDAELTSIIRSATDHAIARARELSGE